jgi:hypothetical protein
MKIYFYLLPMAFSQARITKSVENGHMSFELFYLGTNCVGCNEVILCIKVLLSWLIFLKILRSMINLGIKVSKISHYIMYTYAPSRWSGWEKFTEVTCIWVHTFNLTLNFCCVKTLWIKKYKCKTSHIL